MWKMQTFDGGTTREEQKYIYYPQYTYNNTTIYVNSTRVSFEPND